MKLKKINLQGLYELDPSYTHVARNWNGEVVAFKNCPTRDYIRRAWVDSETGGYGDLIDFDNWDSSMRPVSELTDWNTSNAGTRVLKAKADRANKTPKDKRRKE